MYTAWASAAGAGVLRAGAADPAGGRDRAGKRHADNIGACTAAGRAQRALEYYGQALPIRREVGDRAGEAVTRYNVAMIHRAQGDLGRAVAELEQVVELDRQVSHPDLQSDTEMLHRVRQELAERGPRPEVAMTSVARWVEVHRLAVAGREAGIARDVGGRVGGVWLARSRFADVARLAGLTLTLGEDAGAFYQLGWAKDATGDRAAALEHYGQALRLYRAAGDRGGEAATLNNIGARVPRPG